MKQKCLFTLLAPKRISCAFAQGDFCETDNQHPNRLLHSRKDCAARLTVCIITPKVKLYIRKSSPFKAILNEELEYFVKENRDNVTDK